MDTLRDLLGIRRKEKVLNARIRQLYRVKKVVDQKIDGRGDMVPHGPQAA